MKRALILFYLLSATLISASGQQKFYLSNQARILKQNGDSLKFPFTGGFNSPQFSSIDLNHDSINDLFIFDRSGDKVLTYVSDGNGHFIYAPEYEHLFPRMMNWALLVDYNADGKADIFTHYIDKYTGSQISVFRNTSTTVPSFQRTYDVLRMVRDTNYIWNADSNRFDTIIYDAQGVNNFPTSIPAITDINGDGDIDILANDPNSARAELYYNYSKQWGFPDDSLRYRKVDVEWGYYADGTRAWPEYDGFGNIVRWHEYDTMFLDTYTYPKLYKKHAGGTTMLLMDFDSDGDKELLQGNVSFSHLWFLKNGKAEFSHSYDTLVTADSIWPQGSKRASIYDFAGAYSVDADQDSLLDILVASNRRVDGKLTRNIMFYKNTGNAQLASFTFMQDDFLSEHSIDHGKNSVPAFFDFDGDGDEDLLVAASGDSGLTGYWGDRIYVYERKSSGVFQLVDTDYLNLSSYHLRSIYPAFGDLNGDNKKDLLLGTSTAALWYFRNSSSSGAASFLLESSNFQSISAGDFPAPQIVDINKDNLADLLIGVKNGAIKYYQNTGSSTSPSFTLVNAQFGNITQQEFTQALNPPQYEAEGRAAPHICDLENDGSYDLLVGSFRGYLRLYRNISSNLNGTFTEDSAYINYLGTADFGRYSFGNYSTVASAKVDGDSIIDLMVGNSRGGLTLLGSRATIGGKLSIAEKQDKQLIKAFPNPSSSRLNIQFLENDMEELSMIDMLGRSVLVLQPGKGQEFMELEVSALPSGIYFLRARTSNGETQCLKLLVNH